MKKFDVAVYYRLDSTLASVIANCAYSIRYESNHRFQAACDATDEAIAFAKANDGCLIQDLTYAELSGQEFGMYKGKTRYVIIGVSLKKATVEDFLKLTKKPFFYTLNLSEARRADESCKTANPNIFCINQNYYWHTEEVILPDTLTQVEAEWLEMWSGFDHYYSYSDDSSVYSRWKRREREIYAHGITLGIDEERLRALYRKHYC